LLSKSSKRGTSATSPSSIFIYNLNQIMPAYIIVEVKITDTEKYEEYKKLTPSSIAAYDRKFIVRGGETENLEGDCNPKEL